MGLDTSHDCWHGPYSMFMQWREWVSEQIGLPLYMMQMYNGEHGKGVHPVGNDGGVIPWSVISHPLVPLLAHSDCNGRLRWWECKDISLALLQLIRETENIDGKFPESNRACYDSMHGACKRFAIGCIKAYKAREDVIFR